MRTLKEKNTMLIKQLEETDHPAVRRHEVMWYLRDTRNDGQITLYEEYLITAEALAFQRQSYMMPAWNRTVGISDLVPLLNMKMMALLFQENQAAKMWEVWGMDTYHKNQEKRPHYILDEFPAILHGENNPSILEKLLEIRNRKTRAFDNGPYHDEYYPFNHCAYEELLLRKSYFSEMDKVISEDVEDLLVQFYLLSE